MVKVAGPVTGMGEAGYLVQSWNGFGPIFTRMVSPISISNCTCLILGTWVQCCIGDCKKWRYLPEVQDPSDVPEYWICSHNPGQSIPKQSVFSNMHAFTCTTEFH